MFEKYGLPEIEMVAKIIFHFVCMFRLYELVLNIRMTCQNKVSPKQQLYVIIYIKYKICPLFIYLTKIFSHIVGTLYARPSYIHILQKLFVTSGHNLS